MNSKAVPISEVYSVSNMISEHMIIDSNNHNVYGLTQAHERSGLAQQYYVNDLSDPNINIHTTSSPQILKLEHPHPIEYIRSRSNSITTAHSSSPSMRNRSSSYSQPLLYIPTSSAAAATVYDTLRAQTSLSEYQKYRQLQQHQQQQQYSSSSQLSNYTRSPSHSPSNQSLYLHSQNHHQHLPQNHHNHTEISPQHSNSSINKTNSSSIDNTASNSNGRNSHKKRTREEIQGTAAACGAAGG